MGNEICTFLKRFDPADFSVQNADLAVRRNTAETVLFMWTYITRQKYCEEFQMLKEVIEVFNQVITEVSAIKPFHLEWYAHVSLEGRRDELEIAGRPKSGMLLCFDGPHVDVWCRFGSLRVVTSDPDCDDSLRYTFAMRLINLLGATFRSHRNSVAIRNCDAKKMMADLKNRSRGLVTYRYLPIFPTQEQSGEVYYFKNAATTEDLTKVDLGDRKPVYTSNYQALKGTPHLLVSQDEGMKFYYNISQLNGKPMPAATFGEDGARSLEYATVRKIWEWLLLVEAAKVD